MSDQVMIVVGEVSGDIHAGNLLRELQRLRPGLHAFGVGGERLCEAGLEAVARSEELSHMGLFEVLGELRRIRGLMRRIVAEAAVRRPSLAVLVDSPEFNLRLAAQLGRLGIPVVLYVSPQLWAWRKGRVRVVRRVANEVLCILPFEVDFYSQNGVRARFVGHPLVDDIAGCGLLGHSIRPEATRIGMLPGSRAMEVRQLLPTMLQALRGLPPDLVSDAVLVEAPGMSQVVEDVLGGMAVDPRLRRVQGPSRRHELASCALAWTASGTATLECSLLDVPMVVGYRLKLLTYVLARFLVQIADVALVNLIAGHRVVPELMQKQWCSERLVEVTRQLLGGAAEQQRAGLAEIRNRLGGPGASARAAAAVASYLSPE